MGGTWALRKRSRIRAGAHLARLAALGVLGFMWHFLSGAVLAKMSFTKVMGNARTSLQKSHL